jgi:hypothetical protein
MLIGSNIHVVITRFVARKGTRERVPHLREESLVSPPRFPQSVPGGEDNQKIQFIPAGCRSGAISRIPHETVEKPFHILTTEASILPFTDADAVQGSCPRPTPQGYFRDPQLDRHFIETQQVFVQTRVRNSRISVRHRIGPLLIRAVRKTINSQRPADGPNG